MFNINRNTSVFVNNLGYMGRYANYPVTVEDCLTISISKLKEWEYLNNGYKSGTITWSRNGAPTANIGINCHISEFRSYINLDYNSNGEPRKYKVKLICKSSNLGKGKIWYFLCPNTNKLCRKLILYGGYFLHRTAFKNLMYAKQIESKKWRALTSSFEKIFIPDEVSVMRYKKYFKTHYKGKPTKMFLKLEQRIRIADSYPHDAIEKLMLI